ncbi:MAG: hypothetical protein EOM50_07125 [Erysipelotrichia bacterium]|nr:hypothetical protein [Erysipelotrichia bacterium]NCC54273.1 hypothetical protein [Erysipelotrichia bacterium]
MRVKNKRGFSIALLCTTLGVMSMIAFLVMKEQRFLISSLLFFVYAIVSYYRAFTKKGILEEIEGYADERDVYLCMRSSHLLVKVINNSLCLFTFLFLFAYAIFKTSFLLIVAMTLCSVEVFVFIAYLIINIYFERKG